MAQRRSEEKRTFWRMVIQMQRDSGLTIGDFCKQEGLNPASFFSWRRKLELEAPITDPPGDERDNGSSVGPPELVPVRVIADNNPSPVEVVAPGGFVVRIPDNAATANVRRVLQVLHEVS